MDTLASYQGYNVVCTGYLFESITSDCVFYIIYVIVRIRNNYESPNDKLNVIGKSRCGIGRYIRGGQKLKEN